MSSCHSYGRIIDIVALKTKKMRGQAFIVFKEIQSATSAMRGLNGFNFYDKPMHIEYAKGKSEAIAKLDGTWKRPGIATTTTNVTASRAQAYGHPISSPAQKRQREEEDISDTKRAANGGKEERESESPEIEVTVKGEMELINRILYIQNLPPDVTDEMLSFLFQQYEVRLVPGKSDIAFVEYEADHQAAVAKDVLDGFKITHDKEMKVTFSKR
ncbi:15526_t:CDS:2 [Funneliformis caledonium]|uniref:15526_t:CDS:1 n=1 Tax=Funneliformis caledonium TaxID=1117310 RepID=A0A9N8UZB3_9GLOM|nr:15526_t:CDS:2 [Funneliformis caledonium]